MSERNKASWADPTIRAKRIKGMKQAFKNTKSHSGIKNPCARTYIVTQPNGKTIEVKSLKTFVESKGLNHNSFWKRTIADKTTYKGYTAVRK